MEFKILFRLDQRYDFNRMLRDISNNDYFDEIMGYIEHGEETAVEEYDPQEDTVIPEKIKQLLSDNSLTIFRINIDITHKYEWCKSYPDEKFYYDLDFYINKDNIIQDVIFRNTGNVHFLFDHATIASLQGSLLKLQYLLEDSCDEYGMPLIARYFK